MCSLMVIDTFDVIKRLFGLAPIDPKTYFSNKVIYIYNLFHIVTGIRSGYKLSQNGGTTCLRLGVRVVSDWGTGCLVYVRVVIGTGCHGYDLSCYQL